MRRSGGCIIIPFALFWWAIVGMFDYFVLGGVVRQLGTLNYQPVNAVIRTSEVTTSRDSKGKTTYRPRVTFAYSVNEIEYLADKISYSVPLSSVGGANETVARYPSGSQTTAYVSLDDPQAAVLQKGLEPTDLLLIMFLLPFNMIGIAMLVALVPLGRHKNTGGVEIVENLREIRARLNPNTPWIAVAAALGCGSFAGIFVVFLGSRIFPMSAMIAVTWIAIIALCLDSWRRTREKRNSGHGDLVIHKLDKSLQLWRLPLDASETHSKSALEKISLMEEKRKDSEGDSVTKHVLRLHLKSGDKLAIRESADEEDARAFAGWLRDQLGIPLD